MTIPKFIVITLVFMACADKQATRNKITPESKTWIIDLENDLGSLSINLPTQLDTFFSWIQYSDCGDPCAKVGYRIQPKSLPIFKETGFYYFPLTDSVEQFTIKHSKITQSWPIIDTSLVRQFSSKLKNEAFDNYSGIFSIDTIFQIANRSFAVIAFEAIDSVNGAKIQTLNALTGIDGNLIELSFEKKNSYDGKNSKDFIQNSYEALKTININNGR